MTDTTATLKVDQFAMVATLNRALFAEAARKNAAAALAVEEKKLNDALVELQVLMTTAGVTNIGSALGMADIVPNFVYKPSDWFALHAHIETTEFDLLHRRVNQKPARDRASNGEAARHRTSEAAGNCAEFRTG
jgi:hypothetical protein